MHLREDVARARFVLRVDACRQAVLGVVHQSHRLVVARHLLEADDRPKLSSRIKSIE